MSPAKAAWGWGVEEAIASPYGGRLIVAPYGTSGFMWDVVSGYPNWGYTQNTVTENEKLTRAALAWLTGKTSGVSILLYNSVGTRPFGVVGFQGFVTRNDAPDITFFDGTFYRGPWTTSTGLSGTVTVAGQTPGNTTWTLHDWGFGIDPTEYDLIILPTLVSATYHYDGIDAYLDQGGAIWALEGTSGKRWERYGVEYAGGFQTGGGPPDYLRPAFTCEPLGPDSYRYGIYTHAKLGPTTNTMGGFSAVYGTDALGLWSQF